MQQRSTWSSFITLLTWKSFHSFTSVWIVRHLRTTCCKHPRSQRHFPPFSLVCRLLRHPHRHFSCSSCWRKKPETSLTELCDHINTVRKENHLQSSAYRFFWTRDDTSRTTIPAPTAPMTTPNTMSHGGVSGLTGAASVGGMSMNSRVLSVRRNALLMRFLDFLFLKKKSLDLKYEYWLFSAWHVSDTSQILLHVLMQKYAADG